MGYIRASSMGAYGTPKMREMLKGVPEELEVFIRSLSEIQRGEIDHL